MLNTLRRSAAALLLAVPFAIVVPSGTAEAKSGFSAPFMGWSSWSNEASTRSGYGRNWLTEANIKNAADALSSKLKSAGYTYLDIDSGWNADFAWNSHTDANGIPNADSGRFPSGISAVSQYVHGKELKLGLYLTAGLDKEVYNKNAPITGTSCHAQDIAYRPLTPTNKWGSNWKIDYTEPCAQPYIDSIAAKFASWDVDFVKVDGVTADNVADIDAWSKAIGHSGRPMWLTASAWPVDIAAAEGLRPSANGVRVDTDVECYCSTTSAWSSSVDDRWSDLPAWLSHLHAPDYLPDLDAMPINNNSGSGLQDGINDTERQSVMTFWSMASAPLYVGGDIYFMDSKAVSILSNPEVIAVDQAAVLPSRVASGTTQVWQKTVGSDTYVAVYNLGSSATDITVNFADLGISGSAGVRDIVSRSDLGTFSGSWKAPAVPAHGSRLIKINKAAASASYEAEAGALAGGARTASCTACSGGRKVGYLGNGGTRQVTFYYLSGGPRSADISVNGGTPVRVDFASTGSWNTVSTAKVALTLPNASNSITIGNASGWAPDVDRIVT